LIDSLEVHVNTGPISKPEKQWDIDVFDDMDLPPATPKKDTFIFLINNLGDGVGDFVHGYDFAKRLRDHLHQKGYKLHALVKVQSNFSANNEPLNSRKDFVLSQLQDPNSPFDDFLLYNETNDDAKNVSIQESVEDSIKQQKKWCLEHKKELDDLASHGVGGLEISFPFDFHILQQLPNISFTQCFEYGFDAFESADMIQDPDVTFAQMGIPGTSNNPNLYGLKLHESDVIVNNRTTHLVELAQREEKFVRQLMTKEKGKLNAADAEQYFSTHHLFPGYLQLQESTTAFVIIHALRYQSENKVCDFLLPKGSVDQAAIIEQLIAQGVIKDKTEIEFVNNDSPIVENTATKIRIFTNRIKNDDDYDLIYHLTDSGAGCSGDNSISTVFSSDNPPYIEYKPGPIGTFIEKQVLKIIELSIAEFKDKGDAASLNKAEDLQHLRDYLKHACAKLFQIYDNTFYKKASYADKKESLQRAWKLIKEKLYQSNYYTYLPTIAKSNILYNQLNHDMLLKQFYPNEQLPDITSVTSNKSLKMAVYLDPLKELFDQKLISKAFIRHVFPNLDTLQSPGWVHKRSMRETKKRLQPLLKLSDKEKQILIENPALLDAVFLDIIKVDTLEKILNSNPNEWKDILIEKMDLKSFETQSYLFENDEMLYQKLENVFNTFELPIEVKHFNQYAVITNENLLEVLLKQNPPQLFSDGGLSIVQTAANFNHISSLTLLKKYHAKFDGSLLKDTIDHLKRLDKSHSQYQRAHLVTLQFILKNAELTVEELNNALQTTLNETLDEAAKVIKEHIAKTSHVDLPATPGLQIKQPLTEEQRQALLPSILSYCAQIQPKPIKIRPEVLPEALKAVTFSIFVDSSGEPYALYEGKQQAFKRDVHNHKVNAQVKRGEKLRTGEPVVFKIHTLPLDDKMKSAWQNFISSESELGKEAGVTLTDGYLGDKHYHVMRLIQGKPLKEPMSALVIDRFNPDNLSFSQKITIAKLIIQKLQDLHHNKHILHRDLYGDNILVSQVGEKFEVEFIDFGLSAKMVPSNHYNGPTGDDVWVAINQLKKGQLPENRQAVMQTPAVDNQRVIQSIIIGLNIEEPRVISILENFARQSNFSSEKYTQLIAAIDKQLVKSSELKKQETPHDLISAIQSQKTDLALELIDNGADINPKLYYHASVVSLAMEFGLHEVALTLIEKGTAVSEHDLIYAAKAGFIEVVSKLIEKGIATDKKDEKGNTALMQAARYGHTQVAEQLMRNDQILNEHNNDGETALSLALQRGVFEMVQQQGGMLFVDDTVMRQLHEKHDGSDIVLKLIEKGAKLDEKGAKNQSMLELAVAYGSNEDVFTLIDKGAKVDEKNSFGMTALMSAAQYGRLDVVQKLIDFGAALDEKNQDGQTALMLAVKSMEKETALILIKAGANIDALTPQLKSLNDPHIEKAIIQRERGVEKMSVQEQSSKTRPKSIVFHAAESKKEDSSRKEIQKKPKKPKLN